MNHVSPSNSPSGAGLTVTTIISWRRQEMPRKLPRAGMVGRAKAPLPPKTLGRVTFVADGRRRCDYVKDLEVRRSFWATLVAQ